MIKNKNEFIRFFIDLIINKINSKILAFLSNPKYKKFFQTTEIVNKPWGSARAWTNLSAIFNPIEQYSPQTLNTLGVNYIASSFVDQEAALNFAKYYILFGEINTKDLPTEFILAYLLIHLFPYQSNFNDFFDMCFFSDALKNTLNKYY